MNIESNQEFEALCARLLPKFNEYLRLHSKNIFSCEIATSLDGIKTMPALYDLNGVRKQVIAPLSLLTKNVDAEIAEAKKATAAANTAAGKATAEAAEAKKQATAAQEKSQQAEEAATRADAKIAQMDSLAGQIATGFIAPSRMNLSYPADISIRNKAKLKIAADILPAYLPQSVLYQRVEGNSVASDPSGNLKVVAEGVTKFWVIPTANTPLWQEVNITVRQPFMRLSASGKIRKNGNKIRIV